MHGVVCLSDVELTKSIAIGALLLIGMYSILVSWNSAYLEYIDYNAPVEYTVEKGVFPTIFILIFLGFASFLLTFVYRLLPFLWVVTVSIFGILVNLFHIRLGAPMGIFILFPYAILMLFPFPFLHFKVLGMAKKYGGVLTKSIVACELDITLENAGKWLERFRSEHYCEVIKKSVDFPVVYDFPSARTNYLSRTDKVIVEILRDNYPGMLRVDLLQNTGFSIETLEKSLKRLESRGIIYYDEIGGEYKLRGISLK